MKKVLVLFFCMMTMSAFASNDADTYLYKDECPTLGGKMVVDPWKFYKCECTSYVAYKLNEAGIPFSNSYHGVHWGNASNWYNAARSAGVMRPTAPQVGDVAWFDNHVAYVESVSYPKVTMSEYNIEKYGHGTRTMLISEVDGFIRFTPQLPFRRVMDKDALGNTITIYWHPPNVSCKNADMWCYGQCSKEHTRAVCGIAYEQLKNAKPYKYILPDWKNTFFGDADLSTVGNTCQQ